MENVISFDVIESLIIAISVLFIGRFINKLTPKIAHFNIPEPILGGLFVALRLLYPRRNINLTKISK